MLFLSGGNDRFGRTDDNSSLLDFDPDEQRRKTTILTSVAPIEWKGTKINVLDTPGYFDFVGEVRSALRVGDGAVVVVDATGGVEVGTELVWQYAREHKVPRLIVVNKLDRENTNFEAVVAQINEALNAHATPLYLPVGKDASFKGLVDVIKGVMITTGADGKSTEGPVPADLAGAVSDLKEQLKEAACDGDDSLMEKYLEEGDLSDEEIERGLRLASTAGRISLVVPVAAAKLLGIKEAMDSVVRFLPSPVDVPVVKGHIPGQDTEIERVCDDTGPFSALVWKTTADPYVGKLTLFRVYSGKFVSNSSALNSTKGKVERVGQLYTVKGKTQEPVASVTAGDIGAVAKLADTLTGDTLCKPEEPVVFETIAFPAPVYSVAVHPKTKGDEDKISSGLTRLIEEDPTLKTERNAETSETILSGLGEVHLEVTTGKLKRKFGVDVELTTPTIPYRETIKGSSKVQGRHKKQTGGRGQFGDVWIEFEPLPDKDFEFVDKIFGGSVPRQFIPAVEKGLREVLPEGIQAGYPATNIRATLYDGSYHPVDSSEMAFKIAAGLAFKKGCMEANPIIMEPIMKMEITVPEQFMGDIMGDLNKNRGKILGMEAKGHLQVIRALAPLAEVQKYAIDLRSMTQGRGLFSMEFDHHEEVPAHLAETIIEAAKKAKEQASK